MAEYTKVFENPYPNGWEDLPSENTPITADALQEHTDAIEHLEEYLEENPIEKGGADVEWNQITEDGTKIAEVTINGETTEVFAPQGGGGGGKAFVEMTKAAYDALPDTKLTDGVPRLITDYSEGSSGEIIKTKNLTLHPKNNVSISAGSYANVDFDFTVDDGYEISSIQIINSSGMTFTYTVSYIYPFVTDTIRIRLVNLSSSTVTVSTSNTMQFLITLVKGR